MNRALPRRCALCTFRTLSSSPYLHTDTNKTPGFGQLSGTLDFIASVQSGSLVMSSFPDDWVECPDIQAGPMLGIAMVPAQEDLAWCLHQYSSS